MTAPDRSSPQPNFALAKQGRPKMTALAPSGRRLRSRIDVSIFASRAAPSAAQEAALSAAKRRAIGSWR